ncbi:MAG: serpin family protein [Bacteroidales bacterium]|nr:serpin family protein [Bacteroidales bacterium]
MIKACQALAAIAATLFLCSFTDRRDYETELIRTAVNAASPEENVVVSAWSAGEALSMLAEGAAGETKAEILSTLGGPLYGKMPENRDITVKTANSVWIRKDFKLKKAYENTLKTDFAAQSFRRDFSKPKTVGEINSWCSKNTKGKINSIIDKTKSTDVLYLINALYFNGAWEMEFKEEKTKKDIFHGAEDYTRKFMNCEKHFGYGETENSQIVSLPYKGREYSMVIILPKEGKPQEYSFDPENLTEERVRLSLPKFKVETSLVMNGILKEMGIRKAFAPGAEFSEMTDADVAVDKVIQKCYIDVTESGTEAAAVTAIIIRLTSVGPMVPVDCKIMNVNRPFVFLIVNNRTSDVLFSGRIANPKQK